MELLKDGRGEVAAEIAEALSGLSDVEHFENRALALEQWDAIRLVRTEGAQKIYTFGGAARLAFGL